MSPWLARTLMIAVALAAIGGLGVRLRAARPLATSLAGDPVSTPANVDPPPPVDAALLPDPAPPASDNPECKLQRAWLLAEGPAPSPGNGRRPVALTFDDGPRRESTPEILALLKKHGVHATFFFVGQALEGSSERVTEARAIARTAAEQGHTVGSHTLHHRALTDLPNAKAEAEIDGGIDAVFRATGKAPTLFRPPYGELNPFAEAHLRARGQQLVMWSIAAGSEQGLGDGASLAGIEEQLEFAGGGIVLLHDMRRSTVTLVRRLLEWLDQNKFDPSRPSRPGFDVVDMTAYLRETSDRPQPYADRRALEDARADSFRKRHAAQRSPLARTHAKP